MEVRLACAVCWLCLVSIHPATGTVLPLDGAPFLQSFGSSAVAMRRVTAGALMTGNATLTAGGASAQLPASLARGLENSTALLLVLAAHDDVSFLNAGAEAARKVGHAVSVDASADTLGTPLAAAERPSLSSLGLNPGLVITLPALPNASLPNTQRLVCAAWDGAVRRWSGNGVQPLESLPGSSSLRCSTSTLGALVAAVTAIEPSAAMVCAALEQDGNKRLVIETEVGKYFLLVVPLALLCTVVLSLYLDVHSSCNKTGGKTWRDSNLISDDPRFMPPKAHTKGCSGVLLRCLSRSKPDSVASGKEWEIVEGCRAVEFVIATQMRVPRSDVCLVLHYWRRTRITIDKVSTESVNKMAVDMTGIWLSPEQLRENLLKQRSACGLVQLFFRHLCATHPLLVMRYASITRRRYLRSLFRALVPMFGFVIGGLLLKHVGQGIEERGASVRCNDDLGVFDCMGFALVSVTLSIYAGKWLGGLQGRHFSYMQAWTPEREKRKVMRWSAVEMKIAVLVAVLLGACWWFMQNFVRHYSDRDGQRYLLTCLCILIEQWILHPLILSIVRTSIAFSVLRDHRVAESCQEILGLRASPATPTSSEGSKEALREDGPPDISHRLDGKQDVPIVDFTPAPQTLLGRSPVNANEVVLEEKVFAEAPEPPPLPPPPEAAQPADHAVGSLSPRALPPHALKVVASTLSDSAEIHPVIIVAEPETAVSAALPLEPTSGQPAEAYLQPAQGNPQLISGSVDQYMHMVIQAAMHDGRDNPRKGVDESGAPPGTSWDDVNNIVDNVRTEMDQQRGVSMLTSNAFSSVAPVLDLWVPDGTVPSGSKPTLGLGIGSMLPNTSLRPMTKQRAEI